MVVYITPGTSAIVESYLNVCGGVTFVSTVVVSSLSRRASTPQQIPVPDSRDETRGARAQAHTRTHRHTGDRNAEEPGDRGTRGCVDGEMCGIYTVYVYEETQAARDVCDVLEN